MTMLTDVNLRFLNFLGSILAMILLSISMWLRMHPIKTFSRGELLTRAGFFMLLFTVFFAEGVKLWHWYNLSLWMIAVSVLWTSVGLVYVIYEVYIERKFISRLKHSNRQQ